MVVFCLCVLLISLRIDEDWDEHEQIFGIFLDEIWAAQ